MHIIIAVAGLLYISLKLIFLLVQVCYFTSLLAFLEYKVTYCSFESLQSVSYSIVTAT